MIDGPSPIDPLVVEGPLLPVENLRPLVSLQRMVLLDQAGPLMADLATGDIRRYENGPPVSVPMVSNEIDFGDVERLQVQVLRDPRPTSVETILCSLWIADSDASFEVSEGVGQRLVVRTSVGGKTNEVTAAIGGSMAIVIVFEQHEVDGRYRVTIRARNADGMDWINDDVVVGEVTGTTLTVGGPTTTRNGLYGRTRMIPVQLDVVLRSEPVDQVRRAVRGAKRAAGALRSRVG